MPPKFRQNHDCTLQVSHVHRCQVSARSNLHPEVSQCAKIQGFGLSKTTLQVSTYPTKHPEVSQYAKIQGFGLSKTTLQVSFSHEVRGVRTIQRPNTPQPNTPRSILGSLIASKIPTFQGKFSHLGGLDRPPPAPPRTGGNPSVCVPKNA